MKSPEKQDRFGYDRFEQVQQIQAKNGAGPGMLHLSLMPLIQACRNLVKVKLYNLCEV